MGQDKTTRTMEPVCTTGDRAKLERQVKEAIDALNANGVRIVVVMARELIIMPQLRRRDA